MSVITDAHQLPDQSGLTWLITGATHGIGRETARAAAAAGAHLIIPTRDRTRGQAFADELRASGTGVDLVPLDLTDPESIDHFAASVDRPLDVLINNAGAVTPRRQETPEGHELMLATNFLGPFALTNRLRPRLVGRIVIVGSNAHHSGTVDAADPHFRHRRWSLSRAYAQSKLCDMLWARALQNRLPELRVQLAHPGWAFTNIQNATGNRLLDAGVSAVCRRFGQTADQGALPVLTAAVTGTAPLSYAVPDGFRAWRGMPTFQQPSPVARDHDAAEAVWALGVRETGTDIC